MTSTLKTIVRKTMSPDHEGRLLEILCGRPIIDAYRGHVGDDPPDCNYNMQERPLTLDGEEVTERIWTAPSSSEAYKWLLFGGFLDAQEIPVVEEGVVLGTFAIFSSSVIAIIAHIGYRS